jgi:hypothetical protein
MIEVVTEERVLTPRNMTKVSSEVIQVTLLVDMPLN